MTWWRPTLSWDDPDVRFVGNVARALVDLDQVEGLLAFRLPYPASAQRALDQWVLRSLQEGAIPPASVPGMVEFCQQRPVVDWALNNLPESAFSERSLLLSEEHGLLTDLCHELALTVGVANPWAEISRVLDGAADLCRERRDVQAYAAFRRLLVETPVLDNEAVTSIAFRMDLGPLEVIPKELYAEVSGRWRQRGEARECAACRHLAVPLGPDSWVCESDRCGGMATERAWFADDGPLFQLNRVYRQFVSRPGQVLLELANRLAECGVDVVTWPGYGSYDIRIVFRDGHSWAVQLVDWSSPALAGAAAVPVVDSPQADEAFRVVPARRLAADPHYVRTFAQFQPDQDTVPLLSEAELLARVRHRFDARTRRTDRGVNA